MEKVFTDNPKLDVCYKTSDGKYFFTQNDAKNYASNLENKSVKKLVRDEKESGEKEPVKENKKITSKKESK